MVRVGLLVAAVMLMGACASEPAKDAGKDVHATAKATSNCDRSVMTGSNIPRCPRDSEAVVLDSKGLEGIGMKGASGMQSPSKTTGN